MGMKRTPTLYGGVTRVTCLEHQKDGTIRDVLSSQFTVDYDDGTFGFQLNRLYLVDWKIEERDNGS